MNKLMSAALAASLTITGLGLGNARVLAEEVTVPVMSQADRGTMAMPATGQTRSSVRQHFGDPLSTSGPVGDPPVTQWHYDGFVVYFEYDHVIHTVAKPAR